MQHQEAHSKSSQAWLTSLSPLKGPVLFHVRRTLAVCKEKVCYEEVSWWSKGERGWLNTQRYFERLNSFLEGEWALPKVCDWGRKTHIPQEWSLFGWTLANISCVMSWAHCGHPWHRGRERQDCQQCSTRDVDVVRATHLLQMMIIFMVLLVVNWIHSGKYQSETDVI